MAISPPSEFAQAVFTAKPNSGPWQKFNFSPDSRTVLPVSVYKQEGDVRNAQALVERTGSVLLKGKDALITLDFGVNTAGIITLKFGPESTETTLTVAFSESKQFVCKTSDRSMDFFAEDGVLRVPVKPDTKWTCPSAQMRGAFRYLTMFTDSEDAVVEITHASTFNNMNPSFGDNLRNYSGYFYSDDEFLNKMWYAGAYTVQLSTIPRDTARRSDWVHKRVGYANDVPGCRETDIEVLTDGARRDRTVWSGDRSISQITNFVSLNNKNATNAGVDWMFDHQTDEGVFPYACKPIWHYASDTYHLWTFVDLYTAYSFDGGGESAKEWVREKWGAVKRGMGVALDKIDQEKGLFKVTMPADWGRNPVQGHSLGANCILYRSLSTMSELFRDVMGDHSLAKEWEAKAEGIKKAINEHLWSEDKGMYTDYISSPICPQDGNCLAIWFGIAPDSRAQSVSSNLPQNWNEFGAVAPESPQMISPFISSMELIAHYTAKQPARAMELLRRMWGYIWNAPYSVQSSLIEGYYHDGRCYYPFQEYDPAYISHAHPWSTGPTIVLTMYLVGLRILDAEHTKWLFEPQIQGGPNFAMAGVTSDAVGFISAGWNIVEGGLEMAISAPKSTKGSLGVPLANKEGLRLKKLQLDGKPIEVIETGNSSKSHMYLDVDGGQHSLKAVYRS